jgi:YbbR domain-containing protein
MGKKLTNNWGLKLIAILFALILWFAVINIDDPVVSETFKNVPVQLVNTEVLTEAGKTYEVLENTDVVESITIYGPRTLVEALKENDIVAKADISDITVANTVAVNVTVDVRNSSKITNIRSSLECVKLNVENSKTKQLVINATTTGKLASGCIVGGIEMDQNRVRVSGPASVISQIATAKVNVDITESSSDVATYSAVRLYDQDGNEIVSDLVTKSAEKVHINVDVLPTKYVPIKYQLVGTVADGYGVVEDAVSCDIMTVLIAGETEVLRNVKEITIASDELDITGIAEEKEFTVMLKNYLPSGIILGDKEYDGKVNVKVPVEEIVTEVIEILKEDLIIKNIPEGMNVTMIDVPEYTEFEVTGTVSKVRQAMTDKTTGVIDMEEALISTGLSAWLEGIYSVEAALNLPEGVENTPIKITIEVEKSS